MQRIAVIGCGGAGKTTLANALGRRLGIPVIHIDAHYWRRQDDGRRIESTLEQWERCHRELIARDAWVMDGMKLGVLAERLERADTVVFLDVSTWACLTGIARRRLRHRGRSRPELGIYDQINWPFVRWVWSFRRRKRAALLSALDGFGGRVIVLRRRAEVAGLLASVGAVKAADHAGEPVVEQRPF